MDNKRCKQNKNDLIQNFVNQIQGTINEKNQIKESQTTDKKVANKREGASIKNNLH